MHFEKRESIKFALAVWTLWQLQGLLLHLLSSMPIRFWSHASLDKCDWEKQKNAPKTERISNSNFGAFCVVQKCRYTDFEALNLLNIRSGYAREWNGSLVHASIQDWFRYFRASPSFKPRIEVCVFDGQSWYGASSSRSWSWSDVYRANVKDRFLFLLSVLAVGHHFELDVSICLTALPMKCLKLPFFSSANRFISKRFIGRHFLAASGLTPW